MTMKTQNPPRLSDEELIKIFPKSPEIVARNVPIYKKRRKKLIKNIKGRLIKTHQIKEKFAKWFFREWLKATKGQKLLRIDKLIARYERFLAVASGEYRQPKGWVEQGDIDRALEVPLPEIAGQHIQKLKKSGKSWVGLCPFHNEKHPSFTIFPDNHYKCFGCQEYGNAIDFVKKTHGLGFVETIKFLLNK